MIYFSVILYLARCKVRQVLDKKYYFSVILYLARSEVSQRDRRIERPLRRSSFPCSRSTIHNISQQWNITFCFFSFNLNSYEISFALDQQFITFLNNIAITLIFQLSFIYCPVNLFSYEIFLPLD